MNPNPPTMRPTRPRTRAVSATCHTQGRVTGCQRWPFQRQRPSADRAVGQRQPSRDGLEREALGEQGQEPQFFGADVAGHRFAMGKCLALKRDPRAQGMQFRHRPLSREMHRADIQIRHTVAFRPCGDK